MKRLLVGLGVGLVLLTQSQISLGAESDYRVTPIRVGVIGKQGTSPSEGVKKRAKMKCKEGRIEYRGVFYGDIGSRERRIPATFYLFDCIRKIK